MSACDYSAASPEYGPWNPGIRSELPSQLLPLSTLFRPENVYTTVEHAMELRDATGLDLDELVIFRPERLVLHELLVRITADFEVPDPEGAKIRDLGANFRRMTQTILTHYIEPHMRDIVGAHDSLKRALAHVIEDEFSAAFSARSAGVAFEKTSGGLRGLLRRFQRGSTPTAPPREENEWQREEQLVQDWMMKAQSSKDTLHSAAYRSLVKVISAVRARHGRIWGNQALLARLATGLACNEHGAETIGRLIEPYIREAAEREGYRLLSAQARPVLMTIKGASASGKSTMRPLQRKLAAEIGVRWSDFALISTDIWRKQLLDYGSLGDAFKYAGTFTGRELAIIDRKLDRYMARKGERGGTSHLLIDRFRFDSFAPEADEARNLLTPFGRLYQVYMFFMITPPHETVERAWKRGLETGRYKAVDDLLAHNVEAYTGMRNLFFARALQPNRLLHYEFLDNSVPLGERPRTAAFGWSGEMNVLDVKCMLDIERYRKINVAATVPQEVYPDAVTMAAENNVQFLKECTRRFPLVNFVDRDTGRIYARLQSGKMVWADSVAVDEAIEDPESRAAILAVAPDALSAAWRSGPKRRPEIPQAERFHTLGQWGGRHERG